MQLENTLPRIVVGDLFLAGRTYIAPALDEPFDWKLSTDEDQLAKFWNGLYRAYLDKGGGGYILGPLLMVDRGRGRFEVIDGGESLEFSRWILEELRHALMAIPSNMKSASPSRGRIYRAEAVLTWSLRCRVSMGKGTTDKIGALKTQARAAMALPVSGEEEIEQLLDLTHFVRHQVAFQLLLVSDYGSALKVFNQFHDPCFPVSMREIQQRVQLERLVKSENR